MHKLLLKGITWPFFCLHFFLESYANIKWTWLTWFYAPLKSCRAKLSFFLKKNVQNMPYWGHFYENICIRRWSQNGLFFGTWNCDRIRKVASIKTNETIFHLVKTSAIQWCSFHGRSRTLKKWPESPTSSTILKVTGDSNGIKRAQMRDIWSKWPPKRPFYIIMTSYIQEKSFWEFQNGTIRFSYEIGYRISAKCCGNGGQKSSNAWYLAGMVKKWSK